MGKELDRSQIKEIIRRRKKGFLFIFLLLFITGLVTALALPPIYKSEAMLRVEDQEIKEGIVQPKTNEYIEERIGKLSQQVLSRTNLEGIVEKIMIDSVETEQVGVSELVENLNQNIQLETIVSEMQSKPGGRPLSFTFAFNLSYEGEDPNIVQKVTETLANLYIEEDIKNTERVVLATTDFLKVELERLKKDIEIQERKISEFKRKHSRKLPSDLGYNIQTVTRLERQIEQADIQLRSLAGKRIFLESQLAQVEPLSPIVVEGEKIATNPNQRLKELNMQLTKLKSIYSDKHPDIKKLKNEILELESQVQTSDDSVEKIKRLRQLENELAETEGELGPQHPDVKTLKKEIAILSKEVNNLMTETAKIKISEEKPDNPAYINLVTQINAINTEIKAIQEERESLFRSIQSYQEKIEKTPAVEKELNALTRDYEAGKNKYNEIWNELTAAQVVEKVEGKQRGRRFSLASPASLPTKPYKPNRLAILLVGFLIAMGCASVFAALKESFDNTIKTGDELKHHTGVPVLTSLSYMTSQHEIRTKRLKRFGWFFVTVSILVAAYYFVDSYFMTMEELWSIILDRIMMIV
jgi:uncharacterized protein involved in exopolysaccharide biosynthesis